MARELATRASFYLKRKSLNYTPSPNVLQAQPRLFLEIQSVNSLSVALKKPLDFASPRVILLVIGSGFLPFNPY
jgi:hypothetical protein